MSGPVIAGPNGQPVKGATDEEAKPIMVFKTEGGGINVMVPPDTKPGDLFNAAGILVRIANKMLDGAEAKAMLDAAEVAAVAQGLQQEKGRTHG